MAQKPKKLTQARIDANRRWDEKALDRMSFTVPKGQKATIQAAADEVGESVNKYTQGALLQRMGLEDWPEPEELSPSDGDD
ncbi:MAG: hypothetical protein ACOX7B_08000 [Christensenellales bacterium]|jgi:hypothetical protein